MIPVKFLADEMLASVTRWLRILGFDTLYAKDLAHSKGENLDATILAFCEKTDRVLLTKDVTLSKRAENKGLKVVLLTSEKRKENLQRILKEFRLKIDMGKVGTRCTACNSRLKRIEKTNVKQQVPPKVYTHQEKFWKCTNPECEKVFWKASHWEQITDMIAKLKRKKKK